MKLPLPPHVRWPLFIAGALAIQVLASLATIYVATTEPSYAVEEDYYQKALAWDASRSQQRRNRELGWRLSLEVQAPSMAGDQAVLEVRVSDGDGIPLEGAKLSVEAFHNARANRILRADLVADGDGGCAARLPMRRSGLWELRFTVEQGVETFTQVERRHLVLERR